jgi:hypothetical protein
MSGQSSRAVGLNDLGQISMRANVAFAVRCAQRMRPCFQLSPDSQRHQEQTAIVDRAIRVAAGFCAGLPAEPGAAARVARAAEAVAEATYDTTNFAGFAALRAAEAAAHAEACVRSPSDESALEMVAAAFGAARVLAANADMFALEAVADALYADVEKLRSLTPGSSDVLGPPVDPSENGPLGPLWPAGAPACFAR